MRMSTLVEVVPNSAWILYSRPLPLTWNSWPSRKPSSSQLEWSSRVREAANAGQRAGATDGVAGVAVGDQGDVARQGGGHRQAQAVAGAWAREGARGVAALGDDHARRRLDDAVWLAVAEDLEVDRRGADRRRAPVLGRARRHRVAYELVVRGGRREQDRPRHLDHEPDVVVRLG